MKKEKTVYVAGHRGMVGSAIVRALMESGCEQIITRSHDQLDLTDQQAVLEFFSEERPEEVYLAAARVGGIHANNIYPAEFIYQNLMIEANVINAAWRAGVQKLLFLGSSCIYPKLAPQPMDEKSLLCGPLEPTNEPYAVAKIAGIKLCESYNRQYGTDYRSLMPTSLYGPGDNYNLENSHVIPALLRRFHQAMVKGAPVVSIWGTGLPRREFLHVDDMARACMHVMHLGQELYEANTSPMQSHLNVGAGKDISIRELAETIAKVVGFMGKISFDPSKPDGAPRKLMNSGLLNKLGWQATISLEHGLELTYKDFITQLEWTHMH
jgi:GDP-L-fucose synthase